MSGETHRVGADERFPLQGLRVGISGGVPEKEDWNEPAQDRAILEFLSQTSGLLLKLGGHIVHGGHPAFTPVIAEQARRFRDEHPEPRPITFVFSRLWVDEAQEKDLVDQYGELAEFVFTPRLGTGGPDDPETRNQSLTALRLALVNLTDVIIAVGGKLHRASGYSPGVLEELTLARWGHVPTFVVAGLGGLAGDLDRRAVDRLTEDNQLQPEARKSLAESTDVTGTIGPLVQHLVQHRQSLAARPESKMRSAILDQIGKTAEDRLNVESLRPSILRCHRKFAEVLGAVERSDMASFEKLIDEPPDVS